MRQRTLDLLVCPIDGTGLREEGSHLLCTSAHRFPIIDGLPSFAPARDPIRSSFSQQWAAFDYHDRTWGSTADERRRRFPRQVNLDPEQLVGKLVLDAGCGNGMLSNEITKFECDVVGIDISGSVRRAAQIFANNARLQFIEADVAHPPFPPLTFDIVFSGGVLHHTPDTRDAFNQLARLVAQGGRFYVWLYWHVPGRLLAVKLRIREVISRLPERPRKAAVLALLPQAMARHYWHVLRRKAKRLTWRERLVVLYDSLTPRYRWQHSPEEVESWFRDLGFVEITRTDSGTWGFGIVATRPPDR